MTTQKQKKSAPKPWKQDFRDIQTLPDLKIVRTNFLFNMLAASLLLACVFLCAYQQYVITMRRSAIAGIEQSIRANTAADKRNLADSSKFVRDIKKVEDAVAFAKVPVVPEVLIAELARTQLPQGRFTQLEFSTMTDPRDSTPGYRLVINGTMTADGKRSAPELIGLFIKDLDTMPLLKDCLHTVELVSSNPTKDTDYFEYTIRLAWTDSTAREGAAK